MKFIKLTEKDGNPIFFNENSLLVTLKRTLLSSIGTYNNIVKTVDGLEYTVKESPEEVVKLFGGGLETIIDIKQLAIGKTYIDNNDTIMVMKSTSVRGDCDNCYYDCSNCSLLETRPNCLWHDRDDNFNVYFKRVK